jgi:hypothetical protein
MVFFTLRSIKPEIAGSNQNRGFADLLPAGAEKRWHRLQP